MILDPARPDETQDLLALIESAYRGDSARAGWTHEADLLDGQRTDEAALEELLADPKQHLLVRRSERGLEACIAVTQKEDDRVYIGMVTVAPSSQGKGLGRSLLEGAERYAEMQLGALTAEMTVIVQRPELIAWYERRGYRQTGERRPFPYHDERAGFPKRDDLEFVVLEKRLRSRD
jgi:ribosomal protein S18 acetylase RimI-like enzyme